MRVSYGNPAYNLKKSDIPELDSEGFDTGLMLNPLGFYVYIYSAVLRLVILNREKTHSRSEANA